jgi:uncharacterized membrane protein (UPF0127 family)
MFRKNLANNQGMLFVYQDEGRHTFWMKNMRFPLDIIWIDSNKRVVDIYEFALPCKEFCKTISPQSAAKFILEVNAGFVRKHQIKIGNTVSF